MGGRCTGVQDYMQNVGCTGAGQSGKASNDTERSIYVCTIYATDGEGNARGCHRYFPLVWDAEVVVVVVVVVAEGSDEQPMLRTAAVLSLGFLATLVASLDDARGAPSFMTIFA
ncbi:hypothetical protein A0H81_11746 [Grifola frondosa]|uniref:Uncharacterized protein n=1 Tax=Grifola frondosa TaxID=5627 RepID=A0A1C7LUV0_GRIFR|nr:hypothetical protein A0H81_11746 [Grifola frondosa]